MGWFIHTTLGNLTTAGILIGLITIATVAFATHLQRMGNGINYEPDGWMQQSARR